MALVSPELRPAAWLHAQVSKAARSWGAEEQWLPEEAFAQMLRGPPYDALLECEAWEVSWCGGGAHHEEWSIAQTATCVPSRCAGGWPCACINLAVDLTRKDPLAAAL